MSMNASQTIAAFAANFATAPPIEAHQRQACRALLDTIAVAIAGRNEATVKIAEDYARTLGNGNATVWTTSEMLHPEAAAWVNGVAAHVLDYDDVMTMMRGHISVAMVPALVALAQTTRATGERFGAAYIAGFEVMAKFSRVMALPHYSKGWHSSTALGVLGATVACGVLLGLNETQLVNALGLAVAQAAGSRVNFGSMAKSFQAGQCNAAAVRAVLLAQKGFTANASAIDGKYGYLALYAANEDLAPALATLGPTYNGPLEIDATGIDIKKYPCCYAIHRALDALFALVGKHKLNVEQIERVHVANSAGGLEALIRHLPTTGLEAKFSMEYNMAAALIDGAIRLASFDEVKLKRADIAAFMPCVALEEAPGAILPRWSDVKLTLKDGRVVQQRVSVARGDAGDPLSDDELIAKTADCFAFGAFDSDAQAFGQRVLQLGNVPLSAVMQSLHTSKKYI